MTGKIAVMFPGQGVQYPGMGKAMYDSCEEFRDIFNHATRILGYDLAELCFEGTRGDLARTEYTQPIIFTVSYALYHMMSKKYGIDPVCLAGHSLGEITAVACAGGIDFESGLMLVKRRGELMQRIATDICGGMTAISGIDLNTIRATCEQVNRNANSVQIACYNGIDQTVIAGTVECVKLVSDMLQDRGARVFQLNTNVPSHTDFMLRVAKDFEDELRRYRIRELRIPVLSCNSGRPYTQVKDIYRNLCQQLYMPVNWLSCMEYLKRSSMDIVIDVGPGQVLKNLARIHCMQSKAFAFENKFDRKVMAELEKGEHLSA